MQPLSLPPWKQLVFSLLIITGFFLLVELVLISFAIGTPPVTQDPFVGFARTPLFIPVPDANNNARYVTAPGKIEAFNLQEFPVKKSPSTFRIFSLGGSTVFGHPYDHQTSFSGWLGKYLAKADQSRNWEVINAGGISYASYREAALVEELIQYQPDLLIICTGHNEFLEERTYRKIKEVPRPILQLSGHLQKLHTYNALQGIINTIHPLQKPDDDEKFVMSDEVNDILSHTVGPTSYQRNDELKQNIIEHYKINIRRMAEAAESVGSAVLIIKPAINLKDMSPFKSEHRNGLSEQEKDQWQEYVAKGRDLVAKEEYTQSLLYFDKALRIDNRHAELLFLKGQSLLKLGRDAEAESFFRQAADEDICPLRILTPMANYLEQFAQENGIPFLDFEELLKKDSVTSYGHSILGQEYFLDHVHPTIASHGKMALAILDKLIREGIVHPTAQWGEEAIRTINGEVLAAIDATKQAIALATVGQVLGWSGKIDESHHILLEAEKLNGSHPLVVSEMGKSYQRLGQYQLALQQFDQAIRLSPDNSRYYFFAAQICLLQNELQEAFQYYERMINLAPSPLKGKLDGAAITLAIRLAEQGQADKAILLLTQAHKDYPGDSAILFNLARSCEENGDPALAEKYYLELLAIRPDDARANNNTGIIYARRGDTGKAIRYFQKALNAEPGFQEALFNLQQAQGNAGE